MFHVEQALQQYEEMLLRVNPRLNLVSRQDVQSFRERHLLPCVAFARLNPLQSARVVVDMGSGGGLPGIPLAILNPGVSVWLAESIQKKAEFLRRVVHRLALGNVRLHADRIESLLLETRADVVCARFLGDAETCARLAAPLQAEGGELLLIKGSDEVAPTLIKGYELLECLSLVEEKVVWRYRATGLNE